MLVYQWGILLQILSLPPVECGTDDNQWGLTNWLPSWRSYLQRLLWKGVKQITLHEKRQWKHYAKLNFRTLKRCNSQATAMFSSFNAYKKPCLQKQRKMSESLVPCTVELVDQLQTRRGNLRVTYAQFLVEYLVVHVWMDAHLISTCTLVMRYWETSLLDWTDASCLQYPNTYLCF